MIHIDSLKAVRIQTDLLQLPVIKSISVYKDSVIQNQTIHINLLAAIARANQNEIKQQAQQAKAYRKKLALKTLEIWGYRIGIIAGLYFLIR
jgi:hypothetical protein